MEKEEKKNGGAPVRRIIIAVAAVAVVVFAALALYNGMGGNGGTPPATGDIATLPPAEGTKDSGNPVNGTTDKKGNQGTEPPAAVRRDGVYTFLVIGTDQEKTNTDVIMLVMFDTKAMKLSVLNFPRDTYSNAADNRSAGLPHLNLALAYGGMDGLKREIKNLIGYDYDYYVRIDMTGFVKIINHIGGVDHYIPYDMYYNDPHQNLTISFKKGQTTLNGKQALEFVRAREGIGGGTDIERIERRSDFMLSLVDTLLRSSNIAKAAEIAGIVIDNVKTDLTAGELVFFADIAKSMTKGGVSIMTMPFSYVQGKGYVYPNRQQLLDMINEYFNPLSVPIENINIVQGTENAGK